MPVSINGTGTASLDASGNLNLGSAGAKITGDFSNATVANRVMLQTSTTNGSTAIMAVPNGSGATGAFQAYALSDPTNSPYCGINADATAAYLRSDARGSGTALPLQVFVGSTMRAQIDTSGNLQFNSGYGSVATAYGCRAWVNFNGTGTVAIRASGNVSSITDNGTGDYTVNFTAGMPDTNFSPTVAISLSASSLNASPGVSGWEAINPSVSSCRIGIGFGGSGRNDVEVVNVHILR